MCGFVERLAGVEKECGGCDWAGAKGRGCWVGGLLILLFLVRGLFCAGGGEGWGWFCVGGARGVLVVVVFVYRVVFCCCCRIRSYHCESAWSHPEPRSDPWSRPDSTVMGDRTGSPVGEYVFCFCFDGGVGGLFVLRARGRGRGRGRGGRAGRGAFFSSRFLVPFHQQQHQQQRKSKKLSFRGVCGWAA